MEKTENALQESHDSEQAVQNGIFQGRDTADCQLETWPVANYWVEDCEFHLITKGSCVTQQGKRTTGSDLPGRVLPELTE